MFQSPNVGVGGVDFGGRDKQKVSPKHPLCLGSDVWGVEHPFDDFECGYKTKICCSECKYGLGLGRKDPAAKCNKGE